MFMWTPLFQVLSEQEVSGPTALTKDGVVAAVVSLLTENLHVTAVVSDCCCQSKHTPSTERQKASAAVRCVPVSTPVVPPRGQSVVSCALIGRLKTS